MSGQIFTPASVTPRPLIAVTMGDPSGIGPEVLVKALAEPSIRELGRFVVYGADDCLSAAADEAGIRPFWFTIGPGDPLRVDTGVVVCDFDDYAAGFWLTPRATQLGGQASLRFLRAACDAAREGSVDGLVTGPINKTSWHLAGCPYPGHTELLADVFGTKRVTMAFVGGGLRVALASTHMGLFELRNHFTIGLVFQPIDLLHDALKRWFGVEEPRIAIAGLNPHAGEEGLFGDEERRIIEPAMQMARNAGITVEGPFPADTLFTPRMRTRFDGIVTMYHDQGLIPIKMLAFDIAGTNQADPGSMKVAIRLTCQLAGHALTTTPPTPLTISE